MPIRSMNNRGAFSPDDVSILQAAYKRYREIHNQADADEAASDRVIRSIIRVFENGERNPDQIAQSVDEINNLTPR